MIHHAKEKTKMHELDKMDQQRNGCIEEDRVIVESYCGHVKTLWGMAEHTYCLCDYMYHSYMKLCFAFANFHLSIIPLCKDDGKVECNYYQPILYQYIESNAETEGPTG